MQIEGVVDRFQLEWYERFEEADLFYKQDGDSTPRLHTLIVKTDSAMRVEIDEEKLHEGSIKEDWEVFKQKTINDPVDKKPSQRVERSNFQTCSTSRTGDTRCT